MHKITPYLWFENNAQEAMAFYTSLFKNSSVQNAVRFGPYGPDPNGPYMAGTFLLHGQEFRFTDGGGRDPFTEAISLYVSCTTQEEVDELWEKLSEGGVKQKCGWLKDRFGLSWQIIPTVLDEMMQDSDPEKMRRVMKALLQMDKIDIAELESAYHQKHE